MATRRQLLGMIAGTGVAGVGTAGFVMASDNDDGDSIGNGCTPGFWSQAVGEDTWPEPYKHDDVLGDEHVFESDDWLDWTERGGPSAFDGNLADMTLIKALEGGGDNTRAGAQRILARHAVAALLNAAHEDVGWWPSPLQEYWTEQDVIDAVVGVLGGTREEILELAEELDELNNQDCPISADPGGAGRGNGNGPSN